MRVDLAKVLKQLMPKVDIAWPEKLLFAAVKEFQRIEGLANKLSNSLPGEQASLLETRWQSILKSKNPVFSLAAKGYYDATSKLLVSNTTAHFEHVIKQLAPQVSFKASKNQITFYNVKIKKKNTSGTGSAGDSVSRYERDENFIRAIEKIKHAHILTKYEVENAQN